MLRMWPPRSRRSSSMVFRTEDCRALFITEPVDQLRHSQHPHHYQARGIHCAGEVGAITYSQKPGCRYRS